jgi:iron complex transport system ATP-binding protein
VSIDAVKLCVSYGAHEVLSGVTFSAAAGDCLAVLGPNGVGKSTLFKCLLGFIAPTDGTVTVGGKKILGMPRAEAAKLIAYIPQTSVPTFNYTVLDTVLMGVTNSLPAFRGPNERHTQKALEILETLGIPHLAESGVEKISGGERQLALIARALIQDARVLIMDEPTANLDYGNRFRVMERITHLAANGYTVIFSTHEPNHALEYANCVLALKSGKILTFGEPNAVLTERTLSELYGIGVYVGKLTIGGAEHSVSLPYNR